MIPTAILAQYLGIIMLVFGGVSLFRYNLILQWIRKALAKPSAFFLVGVFEFMIGLAIVLGHQQWASFGAGLVSLTGWLFLAESILYLTLPKSSVVHLVGQIDNSAIIQALAIILGGLGATLTLFGFGVL